MLSHEDNRTLTQVDAAAPLGRFLRRYWIPAAVSAELCEPGGAPTRVRLLGESLVAFRDPQGKVGLVREFCPHRGASLAYARNEDGGLRCLYHGWKIAADGRIADAPAEPATSHIRTRLCHDAYPVREAGGILWAYLGPRENEPPFPDFPWLHLPPSQLLVVKMHQDCNFLQGLEGDLDPAHPNYLHRDFDDAVKQRSWTGAGWQSINELMSDGAPAIHCEETPYLMRVAAIRKTADPGVSYVRLTEWIAPFYTYIATGPHESQLFKAWHPIDDFSCYTFYIHFHPSRPVDPEAIYSNWGHRTEPPLFRTPHTLANMHLQDRSLMTHGNFSGIRGAAIQDRAVQESMGPIYDRTQEHLGTSDRAVIFYRRLILRKIREMDEGKPLPGQDPALSYDQRAVSIAMPSDVPWEQARRWQEDYERAHPLSDAGAVSAAPAADAARSSARPQPRSRAAAGPRPRTRTA
ncbi:MAG TPA: Rieske 2Fe-2S domain-containing protein [Burkholderiaceae bacterium]|nr:Rieske 2Fe-2S domain-containing protein [Burkholderiaceae bacterium]